MDAFADQKRTDVLHAAGIVLAIFTAVLVLSLSGCGDVAEVPVERAASAAGGGGSTPDGAGSAGGAVGAGGAAAGAPDAGAAGGGNAVATGAASTSGTGGAGGAKSDGSLCPPGSHQGLVDGVVECLPNNPPAGGHDAGATGNVGAV